MIEIILWIYIVLLFLGGLMGFLRANSKVSLITSIFFAGLLILCATRVLPYPYAADIVLAVLLLFFGSRYAQNRKFMPGGLMTILTALTLSLRFLLRM